MRMKFTGNYFSYMRKIGHLLLNKYVLALSIFLVWLMFFDKNSMITQWKLQQTVNQLEDEKSFLGEEITRTEELREDLTKNQEKYAREKFFMKKPGEQVFIIE